MPTARQRERLQLRVSVGPNSPIHAALAGMPADQRAAGLIRLAEAGCSAGEAGAVAALERIAAALEARAMAAVPGTAAAAAPDAPVRADRRLARLEDTYGDEA